MAHFFFKNILTLDKSNEHVLDLKLEKFYNLKYNFYCLYVSTILIHMNTYLFNYHSIFDISF